MAGNVWCSGQLGWFYNGIIWNVDKMTTYKQKAKDAMANSRVWKQVYSNVYMNHKAKSNFVLQALVWNMAFVTLNHLGSIICKAAYTVDIHCLGVRGRKNLLCVLMGKGIRCFVSKQARRCFSHFGLVESDWGRLNSSTLSYPLLCHCTSITILQTLALAPFWQPSQIEQ